MMELYLLEQLIAFSRQGTLSGAAGETAYLPACFKPIHEKTGGKSWGIFV